VTLVPRDPPVGPCQQGERVAIEVVATAQPRPEGSDHRDGGVEDRQEQRRGDGAEDKRRDDRVEGGGGERQRCGGRLCWPKSPSIACPHPDESVSSWHEAGIVVIKEHKFRERIDFSASTTCLAA